MGQTMVNRNGVVFSVASKSSVTADADGKRRPELPAQPVVARLSEV